MGSVKVNARDVIPSDWGCTTRSKLNVNHSDVMLLFFARQMNIYWIVGLGEEVVVKLQPVNSAVLFAEHS